MTALITIDQALEDPNLLGAAIGDPATWATWRTVLRAAFGIPLGEGEAPKFAIIAGERSPPPGRVRELWAIVGRRGGKTRMAAAVATYLAAIVDSSSRLSPGEVGYVLCLAASRNQARVLRDYCEGYLRASPILSQLIAEVTAEEIRLVSGVCIAVHTNSHRTIRGRTLLATVFDETAFWRTDDSASPDIETYRAALPALATTNGMLVAISSPYRQTGLLYTRHAQYFGKDDPNVLVVQASTTTFNPTINTEIIAQAQHDDPESARAEWGGEFRTDLAAYISERAVGLCVDAEVFERAPQRDQIYRAFVDVAGGSGKDSMTLAIGHTEGMTRMLDVIREQKPPFNPEAVCDAFAEVLKRYRISTVVGDRYAGEWPAEQFRNRGINFEYSARSRSEIYLDFLPLVNSRSVALLDDKRMIAQLSGLERRTTSSGRDAVDHGPGAHDDVANVVAGVLCLTPANFLIPEWAKGSTRGRDVYAEDAHDPFQGF